MLLYKKILTKMFFSQKNFSSKIGIQPKKFCTLNFGMVWVIMVLYGFVFIILEHTGSVAHLESFRALKLTLLES